jgi:molybdopterin molybdotransferase
VIDFDEAARLTLGLAQPLGTQRVRLHEAHDRILAAPVRAVSDSPLAAVSSMDGWAVREADLSALPTRLRIAGEARPGMGAGQSISPGECFRLFTGAAIPDGTDRVIIQEIVRREGDEAVFERPADGPRFIRARGSDFREGDVLLDLGVRLTPQALTAAAAADWAEVEVFTRPRVQILCTGDELAEPGHAHETPGAIPDSASLAVAALARVWGADVVSRQRLKDDLRSMIPIAAEALKDADVVVVIGGASVGEHDFAKAMFEPAGLELAFSKVSIKPGKPVWVGRAGGKLVVGLPGNPTSALVTARLLLAPLLAGLGGGDARDAWAWEQQPLAAALGPTGDRETFYRGTVGEGGVTALIDQDSGAQKALSMATTLVRRRAGTPAAARGERVETLAL